MPRVVDWVDPFGVRVKILSRHWPASLRFYIFALEVAWTLFRERANYEIAYFLMTGLHVVTGTLMARLLGKKIVMKFSCSGEIVRMKDSWVGRLEVGLLRRYAASLLVLNPGMVQEALDDLTGRGPGPPMHPVVADDRVILLRKRVRETGPGRCD